ncbi:uncharacterized protein LOC144691678 isoform X2 [Cetorhinus maximus]
MPEEHDLLIKYTLSAEMLLNVLRQHLYTDRTGENIEVEPSSIALKLAKAGYVQSLKTGQCVFRVLLLSNEQTFISLRLVNCSKNSSNYWLVQSESDRSIKTIISTEDEGSGCTGMNVAMYNTWVPGSKQIVSKFSQTGLPITSEVIVSGNVLLVTFSPRGECDLPKYSITFLQAPMTALVACNIAGLYILQLPVSFFTVLLHITNLWKHQGNSPLYHRIMGQDFQVVGQAWQQGPGATGKWSATRDRPLTTISRWPINSQPV